MGLTAGKGTHPSVRLIASLLVPAWPPRFPQPLGWVLFQPLPTVGQHLAGVDTQRLGGGGPGEEAPRLLLLGVISKNIQRPQSAEKLLPRPPRVPVTELLLVTLSVNLLK